MSDPASPADDTAGPAFLAKPSSDRRVVALTLDGALRVVWIEATALGREVVRRHALAGEAARLARELSVANLLLAAWVKGEERVALQLQTETPRVAFHGQARADGTFRGRMLPARLPAGSVPDAIRGLMLAIKDDGAEVMYRGVTEIDGEPIDAALQRHLASSDQLATRVRIDGSAGRAFGLLVERLPAHASASRLGAGDLPDWVDGPLDAIGAALDAGHLADAPVDVVDRQPLGFRCGCDRERVSTMLEGLGPDELTDMLATDGGAEVICDFCREAYAFDASDLRALGAGAPDA